MTIQSPIAQYSRSEFDKAYADSRESLFGHLIVERGRSVKTALEELRPNVKRSLKSTESAANWCQKLGISGVGLGVLVGTSMGIGYATLPIISGLFSLKLWADSKEEMPRREAEYYLLRECPNLPEALYALHLRGVTAPILIGAYDSLVSAVEARLERSAEFAESEVGEFLEAKITASAIQSATQSIAVEQSEAAPMAQTQIQGNDQGANQSSTPIAAAPSMIQSKVLCPIEVLGRDPYQSMGVIGGQRTGKTFTAALHTQNVKRKLGTSIIYINLMDANGDAADDWSHADICITCHLRKLAPNKAKAMIEHVIATVDDFFNGLNQILVFDEWVGFTSKANQWPKKAAQDAAAAAIESKEAKTFIQPEGLGTSAIELMNLVMAVTGELTQSGKKQAKAIWLLSPMVKAGAIEPQGLVIKEVQPMVVAISKERTVSWTHPVTGLAQEIGFDDPGYRASIQNLGLPPIESIPKMDCVRMLYTKGTWYSLDNLPALEQSPPTVKREKSIAPPPVAENAATIAHLENAYQAAAVEVEVMTQCDQKPDGLNEFQLVETIWDYLDGKGSRNIKQITDAMRAKGKISEPDLRERFGEFDTYKSAINQVVLFGVAKGFLVEVSEDAFETARKH